VGALLARLAAHMNRGGLELSGAGAEPNLEVQGADAWIDALSGDLLSARGRSLIVAGRRQPPAVHAAVLALNAALGNLGQTVTLHEMPDAERSRGADLERLIVAMREQKVRCLVILGGNPVYDAPADLEFRAAIKRVGQVVHLGAYRDETGAPATWHLPQAHYLESWGDASAVGGVTSVVQPLIAPLYVGRSVVELLGLMVYGEHRPGHDLVRETWQGRLGELDFEQRWRRVLHDGLLADSASPEIQTKIGDGLGELFRAARGEAATVDDLEIVFQSSPAVFDGRYANNGWLQELPDAVTKLTWDNAALLSPATAEALGVGSQDVVRLSYRDRQLEMPVWIVPGQCDHTVAVSLGYGRERGGRIAAGRGFDTYLLRTAAAPDFDRGLRLAGAGRTYKLAQTQDHGSMEGRAVFREASLAEFREHPAFAREMDVESPPLESLWTDHSYATGYQWGMTIDLNTCTGCNACVTACQSENNVPIVGKERVDEGREMHWIRVDRYFTGTPEDPQTVFQPVPCMQCENAPCEQVCPVAATVHDQEGLNTMIYNRCIGTRYCLNNCPYKVRRFNFFNFTKDTPEVQKMAYNPDVTVRSRGVMEKCTYCTQRINAAKIQAKLQGREVADGDIQTACEQACPSQAITFGNIRDSQSRVSLLKQQDRDYVMLGELNNRPRTSYLANLRNPNPDLAGHHET
jgi:molybdopterin-containing oxidoreductase family iron-sulfur binding subunit